MRLIGKLLPGGGTTGQVLKKATSADQDCIWSNESSEQASWGGITGTLSDQTDVQTALDGKAGTGHTHSGVYEPANGNIQSHITSTANPHGVTKTQVGLANVDNTSDANKPVSTATQTALDGKASTTHNHDSSYEPLGAVSTHAAAADPHTGYQKESEKAAANGYAGLDAGTKVPIAQVPTGTTSLTVCIGDDVRLSDSRTPLVHAVSHKSGGADAIKLDELAAPTDVTTLDASTTAHGLMQKYPGWTTNFLRADGAFAAPTAAAADPSYIPGSFTVVTETQRFAPHRLKMTGSQRITVEGTGRLSCLH